MNLINAVESRCTYFNAKVQLWGHLKRRVSSAVSSGIRRRNQVNTLADLAGHIEKLRKYFLMSIGELPESASEIPRVQITGEVKSGVSVIQNIILETRSRVWASANLYLPAEQNGPVPAILFLCGHSTDGKADKQYQSICQMLVSQGLAVLALDPTGQGERLNYVDPDTGEVRVRPGTGDHEYSGFQCLLQGHNLCRYMLHDAIRAVDFLSSHPLIDPARIGITGSSGGGTQTALMMLVEPRLAAAAPATFITTRKAIFDSGFAQDAEQIWPGFTARGYDHADLLAAFAPKPLCILSVSYDYFPIEGTRETFAAIGRFWEMHGAKDSLRAVEDRSTHLYTHSLGQAACRFFSEHFFGQARLSKSVIEPLSICTLRCTRTGQVRESFVGAKAIHSENKEAFLQHRKTRGLDKVGAVKFLRAVVRRGRKSADGNLRITRDEVLKDVRCRSGFWWSQRDLINSGVLLESAQPPMHPRPVTLAIWDDGCSAISRHDAWIRREVASGRAVLVLNLSGMGSLEPYPFKPTEGLRDFYGTFFRICDDLVTLGDSLAALRVYDVLRACAILSSWDGVKADGPVSVYGHGNSGIYGALASVLNSQIEITCWEQPLPSYSELIESEFYNDRNIKPMVIPGLIRYADWPDLIKKVVCHSVDPLNSVECELANNSLHRNLPRLADGNKSKDDQIIQPLYYNEK